ncbi:outer membrane beta-barrel protein [Mucilaginibacter corticis]|uniref:Outer membrane beta-barrel protein n=1 Tax=Mucilaginibacter corticis TaxID=2597670 RepID=A0A556MW47_9SPHI|nr:TonB-dependent receptor [Mucilaginibacter corticis]TSJ44137.1 outer membrane beta-barrel protein [Mucilaginibacter corticis]
MKITILSIALLVLFSLTSYAQSNYAIKGVAVDTSEKKTLSNTVIMVLNVKDSVLRKFTRAGNDGSFAVNGLAPGKFILVMSYPGYADYTEDFTLDEKAQIHDFGKTGLTLKSRLLKDVIIKGEVRAIKIKGDTTEFNAKAYVIQPNDKVEDLIKQFPGIQVDKDGKITAQGQKVTKVLLDGEEFFGDDPTLITKNIRADMVDKVQLYDKKSDQATFTGIDDDKTTKTLNIKLKDGKKAGSFGKAVAAAGTDKYYQGQLMYNKFQNKEKISVYGIGSNNGTTSLNWDDAQKYGDGNNMEMMDDGGMYFSYGGDDLYYNGSGLPKAITGGVHYDNKLDSGKYAVNGNYKIGQLNIDGNQSAITQNNLPDRVINSKSSQVDHKSNFRQKLDAKVEVKLDTTANLKITASGSFKNNKSNSFSTDTSRRGDNTLLNLNSTSTINNNDDHRFDASVFYTKKLKKKGRTLSVLISGNADNNEGTSFLKSNLQSFQDDGTPNAAQPTDQHKTSDNKSQVLNTNITYTEPIVKGLNLVFNYGFNIDQASSNQRAYSRGTNGDYNVLVDSLSNFFKLNQHSQLAGVILNYNKGKTVINIGSKAADVSFDQINLYTGNELKRQFINWFPQASYVYKFSQQSAFRVNYNGNTQQPSISQIQPIKDNSNPLYVTLGNPDLTPSFHNNFRMSYNSYKVISGEDLYISGNYAFTTNPIVSNTSTDAIGKTTSQYFNLSSKIQHSYYGYFNYGRKIAGINVGISSNISGRTTYNMVTNGVNGISQLNTTKNNSYEGDLSVSKYVDNKYDFNISAGPTYSINQSSLQTAYNSNSAGFNSRGWAGLYLPHNWQIGSDIDYTYTAKTAALPQFKRTLWNASISKAFFKEKSLKVMGTVNDILNQNQGFNRYANGGIITEERYTTIKRYFLLTLSYDFSKMSAGTSK